MKPIDLVMSISAAPARDCCSLDDFFTPSKLCRRATCQGIADWKLIEADERREQR
jgi:hypothetical protein